MNAGSRLEERILAKIGRRIEGFDGKTIKVGFFPEASYADGTPIAYVAAIQEYGSSEAGIPPRPFMRTAIANDKADWVKDLTRGVKAVVNGQADADTVLEQIGGVMAANIQEEIADTASPPLSPVTVMLRGMRKNDPSLVVTGKTVGEAAQRVAEGKTDYGASTKPLVDSGLLLASVTHKVES